MLSKAFIKSTAGADATQRKVAPQTVHSRLYRSAQYNPVQQGATIYSRTAPTGLNMKVPGINSGDINSLPQMSGPTAISKNTFGQMGHSIKMMEKHTFAQNVTRRHYNNNLRAPQVCMTIP
jgi:hypothetical protein